MWKYSLERIKILYPLGIVASEVEINKFYGAETC
jgi:hypothetical protein